MNHKELLDAYRSGILTIAEVERQLNAFKRTSAKRPLSEGQKGLWMLQKMFPDMSAYNIPLCFRFQKLDIETFKNALLFVQRQHPILTSLIKEENGLPYQTEEPGALLTAVEMDISDLSERDIVPFIKEKAKEPFALETGPLMRVHVFRQAKQKSIVLITIHHIIFDGVSLMTFMTALLDAYTKLSEGKEPNVVLAEADYHDFVLWEQELLKSDTGKAHLSYWKQQLNGPLPVLELPADYPRSSVQTCRGQAYQRLLPDELNQQIKAAARTHNVNESVVFLAIFKGLLYQYTNQNDVIVGMPTMGRSEAQFESVIGYFINMIAVRSRETGSKSFTAFMKELQLTLAEGLDHAAYPFPALVKELKADRSPAASPVFQTAFFYQNFFQTEGAEKLSEQYESLGIEMIEEIHQEGEFELALEVYKKENETVLQFLYNPDIYSASSIERMAEHYVKLAEKVLSDPAVTFEGCSGLLHKEQGVQQKYNTSNERCIHDVFTEKAERYPDKKAVIFGEQSLTYRELDERSTALAADLQKKGVSPECPVGICTERSFEMVIGILGILKAGGAYVPLDPAFPNERLAHVLADSGVSIVLTQAKTRGRIDQLNAGVSTVQIEDSRRSLAGKKLERLTEPHHLAYILYTSGSTGKPKGVMVEHRAIMNTLQFLEAEYPVGQEDAYLLKTNYVFDVSISELFGWFIGNGRLVILPPDGEKNPQLCMDYIQTHQVTHLNFAPAVFNVFLETVKRYKSFTEHGPVKYVMVAGEAFPKELVKKAVSIFKNTRIENIYGPTETSIYAAYYSCNHEEITSRNTPIGKPIDNTRIYIVDEKLTPVPDGVAGELCVAGAGLARGYYKQPGLTAKSFIDNPFHEGEKLYKTGDLARWLPDGNIEYAGRIDSQVKIRGFRIELGAIETKLSEHPDILDQAVVVQQQNGHKKLTAYYTARTDHAADAKALRQHLLSSLPDYMVPAHFIRLDAMPLSPSGKVNRKDLEQRQAIVHRQEIVSKMPLSEAEAKVTRIWEALLNTTGIRTEDGFFDVGGDSLLAVAAAERIKQELECEFTVTDLFEHSTILAISQFIVETKQADETYLPDEYERERERETYDAMPPYFEDSVAIVGMSCQFPGAKNHHEFWKQLKEGKESVRFFSAEELRKAGVPEDLIGNPDYVPALSTIEGKDLFDPGFFHISPKDAEFMDPQLRLLLLHSWKAVEDAGYVAKDIPNTSVYMSASNNSYRSLLPEKTTEGHDSPDGYVSWVLAQSGTIPTMVSHKLGLKGPSYFVHSNCSSSLVGLYSAYKSITGGESEYALVGGATLHASTSIGYVHQTGLNFSSDGHVKAFDASADGMAGGEGTAVILLKKASQAVEDGDHIYAMLRGIGLNNDGADKVGFYAPSVKGQTEVIQNVLDSTNIHPETVSYIEAHGTGTTLGDPIEMSALQQVYKKYTDQEQYCGIGSVKTNIGHLDTAAGLAGCIKVAMSLYHQELAPTINYTKPNPNIKLDGSPFYVVDERKPLPEKETPHRAALSSFGLGGTNAHAIFEQYRQERADEAIHDQPPYLIPLSAKSKPRLTAYATALLDFLHEGETDVSLRDLAYTYQTGREAMESRAAFITNNIHDLKRRLQEFINGSDKNILQGEKVRNKEASPQQMEEAAALETAEEKLSVLAALWIEGVRVDWRMLYNESMPQRISAPTYPFAEERYWPEEDAKQAETKLLHPLVHQNTSILQEQRFSSVFTGKEYFIAEHIIKGMAIVPAAVTLEMARAAAEQGIGGVTEESLCMRLKHIVWVRPVIADQQSVDVHIGLYEEEDGQIHYRMYGEPEALGEEPPLYNQGIAEIIQKGRSERLDLDQLQRQCTEGTMESEAFYRGMIGADYGPGYKGVQLVYRGDGRLLAKLKLPESVSHTKDDYVLHPSMMDGALQAAEYLQNVTRAQLAENGEPFKAALPFALEELEVLKSCVSDMWVHVTFSANNKAGDLIQKADIDLCDSDGEVCIRMRGFSTRIMEEETNSSLSAGRTATLLAEPVWTEQTAEKSGEASSYDQHIVFLCEYDEAVKKAVETKLEHASVFTLDARPGSAEARFQSYAGQLFGHIKTILKSKPQGRILLQAVTRSTGLQQLFTGITGLFKTASLEHSKLTCQMIEAENKESAEGIAEKIAENQMHPENAHVKYENGKRYIADWREMDVPQEEPDIPWKDRGVYLITGGAGGLGLIFAKEIAKRTEESVIILTGRSALGEKQENTLESLRSTGASVCYEQTDITEEAEVYQLIRGIRQKHGRLDGILHSAGIIKDNYMVKKPAEEFQEVLAPKVKGLVYLDEASKNETLDFFIVFSSLSGVMGSIGQADYASANVFMDVYAEYRQSLTQSGERYGKTLSVSWPLWKEGGMRADQHTKDMLMQQAGVAPLSTQAGINALYQGLMGGAARMTVFEGDVNNIKAKLLHQQDDKPKAETEKRHDIDADSLLEKVKHLLKQQASALLKVKVDSIDHHEEMTKYGLDSISMTEFTNQLNRTYQLKLTPTIFFDHPTIHEFAVHLTEEYEAEFAKRFTVSTKTNQAAEPARKTQNMHSAVKRRRTYPAAKPETKRHDTQREPIAIVGISGIFPMAEDIDAYWQNLKEGKDCMTEIPKDRWDWRDYYGDPAKEANKTNVKRGGFIDGIAEFDPLFFGISPREAEQMDPQQRLLLTYAWKAIEDAGYAAKSLSGTKTGVFIGTGNTGYGSLLANANSAIEGSSAANTSPSVGPNRVSYTLNLHGPSEPIDTACSSSLVAIHHAISSIEEGTCDMALAGGINTIILPDVYISFDKAGALSKEGRCKTFSDQADGFAHGEGAGLFFLKRLKAAEEDGDHIYGVIKGSAVNHGGRAASLTTPNPKQQAEVIKAAYQKAGIDPKTVTYIEAHGTGTELGDPVEINGLKAAFSSFADEKDKTTGYCGLGSVKTNIGHLSLAAGAAGIIKILMQMKHKTLVKSLHCETVNPYIKLEDSPFYLVRETMEWQAPKDERGQEQPRRAGISSFGIGGVNAHIIIEEYIPTDREETDQSHQHPGLFVLSAKNEKRLKEQAEQLKHAIQQKRYDQLSLVSMAYTLQTGRDAMEERLAIIAGTAEELQEKLSQFVNEDESADLYRGRIDKSTLQMLTEDEEIQEAVEKWMARGKYAKLLELWVKGLDVDWAKLYGDQPPKRISLPTYPFAKDRYWVSGTAHKNEGEGTAFTGAGAVLHPLLHRNTSNLTEQRFSSTYTGEEFYLADHVVKGVPILPGVAHLEMARAAMEEAAELQAGEGSVKLKNTVWVRPITIDEEPLDVNIRLVPDDTDDVQYDIYSYSETADPIVYSQGSASVHPEAQAPVLDLQHLQAQCVQSPFTVDEVYDTYRMIGFDYGPAFRGVEAIYTGENFVLGKLSLHPACMDTLEDYTMHPGLMDSALQASSILTGTNDQKLMLPFAVQELEVYGRCSADMWVYARLSEDNKAADRVEKRDIDICDENGAVCVRLKGLSFRSAEKEPEKKAETLETLMFEPVWTRNSQAADQPAPVFARHIVMLCETNAGTKEIVEAGVAGAECIKLASAHKGAAERYRDYAEQVLETLQQILAEKPEGDVLVQAVLSKTDKHQLFSGLSSLLKTAGLENKKLKAQLIEVEAAENGKIADIIKENKNHADDGRVKYENGIRYSADVKEVAIPDKNIRIPWKDGGIYLITGGAGGLGFIFAKEIAAKVKQPTLILTGRSALSVNQQKQLESLRLLGANAEYRQTDVTEAQAAADVIKSIETKYGDLHGIIHSAGVMKDQYVVKKTKKELHGVLAPKADGFVNLDEATTHLALDFFIVFSSISGVTGNPGQADYAAANAFMDSYAAYRNALVTAMYRHGHTLSINWPLWKDGGMQVDEETAKLTMKRTGVTPMRTETGIEALYQAWNMGKTSVLVMEGIRDVMQEKLLQKAPSSAAPAKTAEETAAPKGLSAKLQDLLGDEVSELLKIKPEEIDTDLEFNQYGFDSITLTEFANKLNETYHLELAPTIFFEYATIQTLAAYLSKEYKTQFTDRTQPKEEKQIRTKNDADIRLTGKKRFAKPVTKPVQTEMKQTPEPVAIVGMSGVFPKAKNIDEYWKKLEKGADCITEVPADRWDWREYYGDPLYEANKTNVKWGGFIDGVADFDPLFFGISPLEAEQMDPQQRLLMMYAWKAIEDAGYSAKSLSGTKTGLYIGTGNTGYGSLFSDLDIGGASAANMSPSAGPNRVSYMLNLHGPSEPIDTACSSSLVAIHHAVCAIENGNCDMAIAGGVNTVVTPQGHIAYDKAGALSKEGKCKTFSDRADGFAVSEGAGILFLKKLSEAEKAGDHIYGVIKGSAVNHGGRANSLTTPNPKAQAEVVRTAYEKAGIDPRTVTYIEAHGTGTELGDPVEINGLKAAFQKLYEKTGDSAVHTSHCGLGSAKTNIGHLSLAAGVAGVIKVLMQMKHKTLAKSLHSEVINPYIKLKDSPFYIVQEKREWNALKDEKGNDVPRRAGISSFGIGGVNAHVVIEEYIPRQAEKAVTPKRPHIFVLSAKDEERLKEQAQQLADTSFTDGQLFDMAYTLQAGRDAMEERAAIIASSAEELRDKLNSCAKGRYNISGIYKGKTDKAAIKAMMANGNVQENIEEWQKRREIDKLAELWVQGIDMNWDSLYEETQPKRVSLPTYPFAKERYWITDNRPKAQKPRADVTAARVLHPLLHENISDLTEQRFRSVFTGQETIFTDHMIKGKPVMPGVAYLEMARAAVTQAVKGQKEHPSVIRLKNIVWVQPIEAAGQPIEAEISLVPKENGEIAYDIYTESQTASNGRQIHCQGAAGILGAAEAPRRDLAALKAQCEENMLTSGECYGLFSKIGIDYGPGQQGIKTIYIGNNQALAELMLPSILEGTADQYVLHPCMLDSALQATLGLKLHADDNQLSLPFALEEIDIFSPCTSRMWAYVNSRGAEGKIQRLDIDLCDESGRVCVRIKGISSRMMEETAPEKSLNGANLLAPVWDHEDIREKSPSLREDQVLFIAGDEEGAAFHRQHPFAKRLCIAPGDEIEAVTAEMKAAGPFDHIVWIAPSRGYEDIVKAQDEGVIQMYRVIKAMLALGYDSQQVSLTAVTVMTQSVLPDDIVSPVHAGLHGLIGSLAKEFPNWKTRLIDAEDPGDVSDAELFSVPFDPQGHTWAYRNNRWYKQRLIPVQQQVSGQPAYQKGGVYVVIGGAGGIGEAWSEYAVKTYQARVIWIGRRKHDSAIQAKIDRLAQIGPAPVYIEADAANLDELRYAYETIKRMHPRINGIIHSAIVLEDQSLANMPESRFKSVLAAKVDVSVNMARVFQKEPLDFALFFSSVQSFARAAGQSNYAAGCSFKDAFAAHLSQVWPCTAAVMNWSYWGSVGIVSSSEYQERMKQAGVGSIEAPEAMAALERLLGGPLNQLVMMKPEKEPDEQPDEIIEVYPEHHGSAMQKLRSYRPKVTRHVQQLS
ncbi:amino acid adenylation domain-containing protein [Bacillus sp. ISL-51]|uniref:non-ribosomal peptide synthetase n=1 Tax=Bacteria TaxID=2 RepID=UPI001BEAA813|nr:MULTISPECIES: non-ribosomal peptide synthetase [Bacteria]MBT2575227.1 amino acid adenylation domain-containing protein [Bacillus sp. ISL-51]MBT2714044.1 amino acid adenylation domain-containing protein [Pseudomonas sp. ISL-88]